MTSKLRTGQRPTDEQRRHFFQHVFVEALSICEAFSGQPQLKVGDLSGLPDEVLRTMIPVFKKREELNIKGSHLMFFNKRSGVFETVTQLRPEQKEMIDAINGYRTLHQVAQRVARRCQMEEDAAYGVVKPLFCLLARIGVCTPRDAINQL